MLREEEIHQRAIEADINERLARTNENLNRANESIDACNRRMMERSEADFHTRSGFNTKF